MFVSRCYNDNYHGHVTYHACFPPEPGNCDFNGPQETCFSSVFISIQSEIGAIQQSSSVMSSLLPYNCPHHNNQVITGLPCFFCPCSIVRNPGGVKSFRITPCCCIILSRSDLGTKWVTQVASAITLMISGGGNTRSRWHDSPGGRWHQSRWQHHHGEVNTEQKDHVTRLVILPGAL